MIRLKIGLLVVLIISMQVIVLVSDSSAIEQDISWEDPTLFSLKSSSGPDRGNCNTSFREIEIVDEASPKIGCVVQGYNIRFGYYAEQSYYKFVIGFINDSKMYHLNIGAAGSSDVLYSANHDSLIVKQFLGGNFDSSGVIKVYKDLGNNIKRSENFSNNKTYELINSMPEFTFLQDNGSPWPVEKYSISSNGDWVALQLRTGDIALLDVKNNSVKFVYRYSFAYGQGTDPVASLTVSNDGRFISMTGTNLGLYVFTIDSGCGKALHRQYEEIANQCEIASINPSIYLNLTNTYPKFNDNNNELSFYGYNSSARWYSVILRVRDYIPPRLTYLALGDSFSSGEGDGSDVNYAIGTNNEYEKCHLSGRSYPFAISYNIAYD